MLLNCVLEKTLASPLDCKETKPVNPKGNQSWVFFGRTDAEAAEAETPILCPPDAKSWLIGKDSDAGRDWGQEEKGMTGWNGWMASLTRWTWVWVDSGSWWWTRRPGVLWFMGWQRVGHDWVTELNELIIQFKKILTERIIQMANEVKGGESRSVMSNSLRPYGLHSPWNSPGQNTGVDSFSLLQGIFPTQGSNPGLPHCRQILYQLSHKGSPHGQ